MIETILILFVTSFSLGSITWIAGWSKEDLFERCIITFGIGLILIPIVGVFFNLCGIPIDYRYVLCAAIAVLLAVLVWSNIRYFSHQEKKRLLFLKPLRQALSFYNVAAIIIFGFSLFMYLKGAFAYSWFEDSDPWRYGPAIKYIELFKTYTAPNRFIEVAQPYPQGYQIIMALLTQVNHSLNWTVKFFNSLFIAFSILFFYVCARKMISSAAAALLATAALASMPAWLSHFIFAINFSCVLVPLFFYSLVKADENKRWWLISMLIFTTIWLTHFSSAFVTSLLFVVYYATKVFCENRLNKRLLAIGAGGFLLSLLFWIPSLLRFSHKKAPGGIYIFIPLVKTILSNVVFQIGIVVALVLGAIVLATEKKWLGRLMSIRQKIALRHIKPPIFLLTMLSAMALLLYPKKFMILHGSGSMPYSFNHFFLVDPKPNLIQNPYGIGPLAMVAAIIAFVYMLWSIKKLFSPKNVYRASIFSLVIFTGLSVNSARFSINLIPFRLWSFFAFAIALLVGLFYHDLIEKKVKNGLLKILILVLLCAGFIPTWKTFKYPLNTSWWRENWVGTTQGHRAYNWIKDNLPKNSTVYSFGVDQTILAIYDMTSAMWDPEIRMYRSKDLRLSLEDNYSFFKTKGYEYVLLDEGSLFFHQLNRDLLLESEMRKRTTLVKNSLYIKTKKIALSKAPDKFRLIKEFKGGGLLFKIL